MTNNLSWRDALKEFNDKRTKEGGKYTIPKRGTPEYAQVRELMGEKITDAAPLKPNQTVTGQTMAPSKSRSPKKPTDSEEKIHTAVQTIMKTTKENEPKPVEKKTEKKPKKAKEDVTLTEYDVSKQQELVKVGEKTTKPKKSKKFKSLPTQTEPPSTPKSDDFKLKLN